MKRLVFLLLCAAMIETGWGKTVGLWRDDRSYITDGMLKTLQAAGWQTVILSGKDLSDEAKLSGLDVVFLPGGWNAYWFADFRARRALVKFVASGKGILAGAFRSGYVRTANRPLLPQVGATYNRVNGPIISPFGDSELAKAIDQPFCPGGWDHLVVKVGPLGRVFAVNGEDPVGVYGEVFGGRYLVFGAFLGMDAKTEPMTGTPRNVLLKSVEWLASAPRLSDAARAKSQAEADLDFIRREKLWDWTLNDRGPDRGPGILYEIRNSLAVPIESRQFTLKYMGQFLSGGSLEKCRAAEAELGAAMKKIDAACRAHADDTTGKIGKMSLAELTADNPFFDKTNVMARIDAMPGKTEAEKASAKAALNGEGAPRAAAMFLNGGAIREKFMPEQKLKDLIGRADKTLAELRPAVKAAKAAKAGTERKADIASLPALVEKCASADARIRQEAALELGRIGDPKGAPALIKMLKDADEKVRINAILGLGWMQSKDGVPELIKLADGKDIPMRRRAVQALGQVGDARAIDTLLANMNHKDYFVSENAIMALGWLKAKAAVPGLLKNATALDPKNPEQRGLMLASIRALGHIGDPSALPALEKLALEANDFPTDRRDRKVVNIYSTAQTLGLQGHAELAAAEIKAGGRKEVGIKQPDFLAGADKFYGLTRRFNALAGRIFLIFNPNFSGNHADILPYLWEGGMTGVHQAWGGQGEDPEKYCELVKAAGEFDMLWVDVMPQDGNWFGAKVTYGAVRQHGIEKPGVEEVLFKYRDVPAFQGFWSEESYPDVKLSAPEFEAWLVNKHGAGFRKKLGVAAGENLLGMTGTNFAGYSGPLKTEYTLCCGEKLLEHWRESQEWMTGVRKGCSFTYSVSTVVAMKYPGVISKAGTIIDVNGPEEYQAFGRYNGFFMEMHKDGEARPVMCEFYNWYGPSPAHDERGFAQHLMHGECFYNFCLNHVFDQASTYDMWSWDAARWGVMKKLFQKARDTGEYLAVPASAANVALLCSELSFTSFYLADYGPNNSLLQRWYQHQAALWTALNQSQIPSDIIWTETLTPAKLARYKALVLADAKIVTEDQAKMLREWVNAGGTLIAGGTTSLFDQWAREQKNYGLSDLFGLDYLGHAAPADPSKIDTYGWRPGGETIFKIVPGLDPKNFRTHVHRDIKPVKSLGTYKVSDKAGEYLPGLEAGAACEYDMPLGYDKVKPGTAEVLAKFAGGDPALTVNKVGKGLCYFWTPIYPGMCHATSGWEMQPNYMDFWPNVRELLSAMVRGGLSYAKADLPVDVSNVSKEVEVTVRQQPGHNRWIVHLLDYDPKSASVKGAAITLHPPAGGEVRRIFHPDTGTDVKFTVTDAGVTANLRDFKVHDMVVVEWK
ncbi:MAG: hypothetical protein GX608_01430 [Lentisphaerae bacterium]|nr:hypothetical protein [Lentisphaerota bacterium]